MKRFIHFSKQWALRTIVEALGRLQEPAINYFASENRIKWLVGRSLREPFPASATDTG